MIHIIPLTERDVEYKCHLIEKKEWDSVKERPKFFSGMASLLQNTRYDRERKAADELNKQEKKCPFGFGK
jgi:hypothetical protein